MVGVDPASEGLRARPGARRRDQRRGRRLAARPGRATGDRVRGDLRRRAPRATRGATTSGDPGRRPHPGGARPICRPRRQPRRAPRRAEPEPDLLRRAGDDPDRRRRQPGHRGPATRRSSRRSPRPPPAPGPARISTSSPRPRPAGVEPVGGAAGGRAIIILNPAEPPITDAQHGLRRHSTRTPTARRIAASIVEMVAAVAEYVPGYRLTAEPAVRRPATGAGGQAHASPCCWRSRAPATSCRPTPATLTS